MILLIRHCTPKINYGRCSYSEAKSRIDQYNTTKVIDLTEINPCQADIDKILKQQKSTIIYASSSP